MPRDLAASSRASRVSTHALKLIFSASLPGRVSPPSTKSHPSFTCFLDSVPIAPLIDFAHFFLVYSSYFNPFLVLLGTLQSSHPCFKGALFFALPPIGISDYIIDIPGSGATSIIGRFVRDTTARNRRSLPFRRVNVAIIFSSATQWIRPRQTQSPSCRRPEFPRVSQARRLLSSPDHPT